MGAHPGKGGEDITSRPVQRSHDKSQKPHSARGPDETLRKGLSRKNPLVRKTPLAAKSARQRAFEAEFARARALVRQRSEGLCEARISLECRGVAEHCHHRAGRWRKGANDPLLLLDVCWRCHQLIHDRPALSYRLGFLVHAWTPRPRELPAR
jgi:hypothetical protein